MARINPESEYFGLIRNLLEKGEAQGRKHRRTAGEPSQRTGPGQQADKALSVPCVFEARRMEPGEIFRICRRGRAAQDRAHLKTGAAAVGTASGGRR
jgi:hypothetical protein